MKACAALKEEYFGFEGYFSFIESPSKMSSAKLAFVGDAVFELIVRHKTISKYSGNNIGELNKIKVTHVSSKAQSNLFEKIIKILTPEEIEIYKRGRNAHVNKTSKKISPATYHRATGVETLFGFLYLSKQFERLKEIAEKICL